MNTQDSNMFKFVLIARNDAILISYPPNLPEMLEKSIKILKKLDTSSPFAVIEQNNLLYTASTDSNNIIFLCVCDKSVETPQVGKFLTTLKHQWMQNYGAISQTISPGEKSEEFCPKIKELVDNTNEKLRPTLSTSGIPNSKGNPNTNVITSTNTNVNEPLLNNRENSILPNPFATSNYNNQGEVIINNPEMFDEDIQERNGQTLCNYLKRNRFVLMLIAGIILIIYFSISFYCEDFNVFRCSGSSSK